MLLPLTAVTPPGLPVHVLQLPGTSQNPTLSLQAAMGSPAWSLMRLCWKRVGGIRPWRLRLTPQRRARDARIGSLRV